MADVGADHMEWKCIVCSRTISAEEKLLLACHVTCIGCGKTTTQYYEAVPRQSSPEHELSG